jgi:hypothetical protein
MNIIKNINELHEEAMNLAESAFIAKLKGNAKQAFELSLEAFEKETKAANLVPVLESEPTRSILFRSAAALALDCNKLPEAEKLAASGLAGNPPEEIANELREIFEKVNFERHLGLNGLSLTSEEVQMSIAGSVVTTGIALSDEFIIRIDEFKKLIRRTVERLSGKPYQEGGAARGLIRDYALFISVPRAASFAVSLKISSPKQ